MLKGESKRPPRQRAVALAAMVRKPRRVVRVYCGET